MTGTIAANDRRMRRQEQQEILHEKVEDDLVRRIETVVANSPGYLIDMLACMQELAIESGDFDELADRFPTLYLDPAGSAIALRPAGTGLIQGLRHYRTVIDEYLLDQTVKKAEADQ